MLVLRADGRVIVLGQTALPDPPPPPIGVTYERIAIGGSLGGVGVALRSDGELTQWDTGSWMQPPALPANTTYVDVSVANLYHAVALRSDGVAVTWQRNGYMPLLPPVPAGQTVLQAHAGYYRTILLLSNGTIVESGGGWPNAAPALPAGMTYTEFWGGDYHAFARRSDGAVLGWGFNDDGQAVLPVPPAGTTYESLSLGWTHTIATRSDGVFVGVGANDYQQLDLPAVPAGQTVAEVVCGGSSTALLLTNGDVLPTPATLFVAPRSAPTGQFWAGHSGFLALTSAGEIVPLVEPTGSPLPALPPGLSWIDVASGSTHGVALRSDGRALAWGSNSLGQLAIPPLPPGMTYTQLAADRARTILLRSDGHAVECGNAGVATLPPHPTGVTYVAMDGDDDGTILLRSDGTIDVVGGQLTEQLNVPPLPPRRRYVAVSMLRYYCAAIRSDGELVTWGASNAPAPPPPPPGVSYVEISGGERVLFARRSDGTAIALSTSLAPAPEPTTLDGESIVGISAIETFDAGVARFGPETSYVTFAPGCAGTLPQSRIVPRDTPRIGRTLRLNVLDLPHDIALLVTGWSTTAPISLAALGMPGCDQHITLDATAPLFGEGGEAQFAIDIPDTAALVGATFAQQALVLDLSANPAGFVASDAATAQIGRP